MNLTMAEAKRDFERGYLKSFTLVEMWDKGAWGMILECTIEPSAIQPHLVDARTKKPREFKTLDAAINAAREIGFTVRTLLGD